jgi:O-methyltransferase
MMEEADVRELYLELLKRTLTRYELEPSLSYRPYKVPRKGVGGAVRRVLQQSVRARGLELTVPTPLLPEVREVGNDWPSTAETMIGLVRINQLQEAVETVLDAGIPGDLIETGAWRGGACIFMRALLTVHNDAGRTVWVADSFEGLPRPDPDRYPVDQGDIHHTYARLAISLEEVQANFAKYGMLDDRVQFLKGWFRDTLPTAPIERLAVLRLDGDMYESTIQALDALYDKVSPGGYVIVDDYHLSGCRTAVDDFRSSRGIAEPIEKIDWSGVYWRRSAAA